MSASNLERPQEPTYFNADANDTQLKQVDKFIPPSRSQRRKNARDHAKAAIKQNIVLRENLCKANINIEALVEKLRKNGDEITQLKTIIREMILEVGKLECQTPDAPGMPCGKCLICEAKEASQQLKEEENVATETDQEPA